MKKDENNITTQIDIIIYKKQIETIFKENDLVVLKPESVLAIIEVKSKLSCASTYGKKDSISLIEKSHNNGKIINNENIFNGIFSFDSGFIINQNFKNLKIGRLLKSNYGYINHICFDSNVFCKFWTNGNPVDRGQNIRKCYSFYNLSCSNIFNNDNDNDGGLAIGYFISNLLESVDRQMGLFNFDNYYNDYYEKKYPLKNTKEKYRYENCDIKI